MEHKGASCIIDSRKEGRFHCDFPSSLFLLFIKYIGFCNRIVSIDLLETCPGSFQQPLGVPMSYHHMQNNKR
jgi:hypothetical protein